MAAERNRHLIAVHSGQPSLSGVDDDNETVRCVAEDGQPSDEPSAGAKAALSVIGAWRDMDWDELAESLDRIRDVSTPTPLIEE